MSLFFTVTFVFNQPSMYLIHFPTTSTFVFKWLTGSLLPVYSVFCVFCRPTLFPKRTNDAFRPPLYWQTASIQVNEEQHPNILWCSDSFWHKKSFRLQTQRLFFFQPLYTQIDEARRTWDVILSSPNWMLSALSAAHKVALLLRSSLLSVGKKCMMG